MKQSYDIQTCNDESASAAWMQASAYLSLIDMSYVYNTS